jgi:capsular polysaccharide biosynthesis protein
LATNAQDTPIEPRIDALTALRRHWFVALIPVIIFVAAAVVLGAKRPPRYTATANLSVGHVYVSNAAGIPTIIDATQSLAAVYSRAIHSGDVTQETRRLLRNDRFPVSGGLSATPIPESPLIKVTAQSSSRRGAVMLANAGSTALAGYVNRQVRDNSASTTLSQRYREAALRYRQRLQTRDRLGRRYRRDPTRANKEAYNRAAAAVDTAMLNREALQASYQEAVQGGTTSVNVSTFSRASAATSDRSKKMQLFVFVGLVGGIAAGTALALLRTSRDIRRHRV